MGTWTIALFGTYSPQTLAAIASATSSRASRDGHSHSLWLNGRRIAKSGPAPAHASPSAAPARARALQTVAISGQTSSTSLTSAALQQSLESRLRTRTHGSVRCTVTWKRWDTPWGQCQSKPHVSVRRIGEIDTTLLPSLTAKGNLLAPSMQKWAGHRALLPALMARDFRWPGKSRKERTGSTAGEHLPNVIGGPLNPAWTAWYQGYPPEWDAFAPMATRSFRKLRPNSSGPRHEFRSDGLRDGES